MKIRTDLTPTGMLPCDLERLALEATQGPGRVHEPPSWLRLILWTLVATAALALLISMCGCGVTTAEHRSFVESSRSFYDRARPVVESSIASEAAAGKLNPQSAKNRREWLDDYGTALEQAERRSKLK